MLTAIAFGGECKSAADRDIEAAGSSEATGINSVAFSFRDPRFIEKRL
jgi:hypothetical protein